MRCLPVIVIVLVFFTFCTSQRERTHVKQDEYSHIADNQVRQILMKAIDKAGGIEAWQNLKTIEYTKHSILFLEDSTVEVDHVQRHKYTMQPEFGAMISWTMGEERHLITYTSTTAQKFVNDTLVNEDPSQSVMSAIYVLGMPFKLLDPGTTLEYVGEVRLESGEMAKSIKATYDPNSHDNHSTQDEWYYYFAPDDGSFLGAMVYHPPTYAYIRNLEFDHTTPIQFHKHRKSYRSDSARNIKFLRAEFWYSDYEIEYK
ncbi:MAG: DUF6503 family protein [Bacteroidota bacterium]